MQKIHKIILLKIKILVGRRDEVGNFKNVQVQGDKIFTINRNNKIQVFKVYDVIDQDIDGHTNICHDYIPKARFWGIGLQYGQRTQGSTHSGPGDDYGVKFVDDGEIVLNNDRYVNGGSLYKYDSQIANTYITGPMTTKGIQFGGDQYVDMGETVFGGN